MCFEDECIEYPQQYAIPLITFIKPTNVWKLDLSPLNCEREAKILHNLMIEKADKFHWGHETKFKALFSKGKLKYRNPTYRDWETDRKSTRLNSSHRSLSRMPSSA